MNKPTDYPVENQPEPQTTDEITLAMLSDRLAAKQPVTPEMIQAARSKMEMAHANTTTTNSTESDTATQSKFNIGRIRDRFR